jgi:NagD protein
MDIPADEADIFTCAMATARFLASQKPGETAYVIGEGGLLHALHRNGYTIVDQDPDYVVVGEGRTFTMEAVEAAVRMIFNGAKLVATNLDPNCPTQQGMRPGCGAVVAMLEAATGIKAFSVGKPSPVMMRGARKELGLVSRDTTIIGDTMETDILGGVQLGYRTVLVLSGGTRPDDLAKFAFTPDVVVDSVADLNDEILLADPCLDVTCLRSARAQNAASPRSGPQTLRVQDPPTRHCDSFRSSKCRSSDNRRAWRRATAAVLLRRPNPDVGHCPKGRPCRDTLRTSRQSLPRDASRHKR